MKASARLLAAAVALCAAGAAWAQGVALSGSMGSKALLVIDGKPRTLAVGESADGVTLLSLSEGQAQVRRNGAATTLRLGGAPVNLGTAGGGDGGTGNAEVVLSAGPGGHFIATGAINGRSVQFMVDTGATLVAIPQAEAERIGLDWRSGQPGLTQTANGVAPVHRITLRQVRLGEVSLAQVQAVVTPSPMPYILLGNSFLSRFQMRRDNDVMRLTLQR